MKRINFIDFLRVGATLAVILIHTTDDLVVAPNHMGGFSWAIITFLNTIARFAVPLFFIISGYLHKDDNDGKDFKKNIKKYTPIFLWIPLYWILYFFLQPWKQNNNFNTFLISLFKVESYHLYFIEILLMVLLVRSYLGSAHKKLYEIKIPYLFLLQIIFLIIYRIGVHYQVDIWLHNIFTVGILYLPTYLMGHQLKIAKNKFTRLEHTIVTLLSVSFVILCFLKSSLHLPQSIAGDLINNVSPIPIGFALMLLKVISDLKVIIRPVPFVLFGKLCLFVYIIHPLVILFVNRLFHLELHLLSGNLLYWYSIKILLITLFSFVVSYLTYSGLKALKS